MPISDSYCPIWTPTPPTQDVGSARMSRRISRTAYNPGDGRTFLFRTGSTTYVSTSGAFATAGDCIPRFGVNGLILEGVGTNMIFPSEDFNSWSKDQATVTTNTAIAPDGTLTAGTITDDRTDYSEYVYKLATPVNSLPYCFSVFIKKDSDQTRFPMIATTCSGATSVFANLFVDTKLGICKPRPGYLPDSYGIIDHGTYWRVWLRVVNNATGNTELNTSIKPAQGLDWSLADPYTATATGSITCWGAQLEQSPFPTSYIPTTSTAATRSADMCAVSAPHNELRYSHDLTNAAWAKTGFTVSKTGDTNTLTFSTGVDSIIQTVTAGDATKQTRCVAVKVKQGTATSGICKVYLMASDDTVIATGNIDIDLSKLSPTAWTTVYATGTNAKLAAGTYKVKFGEVVAATTGATVLIKCLGANEGSFPSIEVMTADTQILNPGDAPDPAWVQNGSIEFDVVPPSISAGLSYALIGQKAGASYPILGFWRSNSNPVSQNFLLLDRKSNSETNNGRTAIGDKAAPNNINPFDGAKHHVKIMWQNYIFAGIRYMWLRSYIDGYLWDEKDAAALYGATAWIAPERIWLSDGNTVATISYPVIGYPPLPAGATL